MDGSTPHAQAIFAVVAILAFPSQALAYIGPGVGLTVIGSLLGFLAAIVLAILGFLWFPIRRMLRKRTQTDGRRSTAHDTERQADQAAHSPSAVRPGLHARPSTAGPDKA